MNGRIYWTWNVEEPKILDTDPPVDTIPQHPCLLFFVLWLLMFLLFFEKSVLCLLGINLCTTWHTQHPLFSVYIILSWRDYGWRYIM